MKFSLDAEKMEASAERAARFLKSIANGVRLKVLCKLMDGEKPAGELSRELGISQANLSQHLIWLKNEGLVRNRRAGTVIFYRLAGTRVEPLMNVLYSMFCESPGKPAKRRD